MSTNAAGSSRFGEFMGRVLGGILLCVGTLWGLKGCVSLENATDGVDAHAQASRACVAWGDYKAASMNAGYGEVNDEIAESSVRLTTAAAAAAQAEMRYQPLQVALGDLRSALENRDQQAALAAIADVDAQCEAIQAQAQ